MCNKVKENNSDYCQYHTEALSIINEKYPIWERAFGGISWKDYLDTIIKNPKTGEWIKDVAKDIIKKA